jgi:hypothetical protein
MRVKTREEVVLRQALIIVICFVPALMGLAMSAVASPTCVTASSTNSGKYHPPVVLDAMGQVQAARPTVDTWILVID